VVSSTLPLESHCLMLVISSPLSCQKCSLPRNHLLDTEKSVLEYQTSNVASILVLDSKPNTDSSSQTLAVDDDLCFLKIIAASNVVKSSLRINGDTLFVRIARGQAVSSVLKHQDIAIHVICQDFSNRKSMTDVSSISMEH
jgi:hypothetical protein